MLADPASSQRVPTNVKHRNIDKPKKKFLGRATASSPLTSSSRIINQVPFEILEDKALNSAITRLPSNYSFEIHKTVHQIRKNNAKMVALQLPEGLQMFACTIADIIEECVLPCTSRKISFSHPMLVSRRQLL